ncbi:hypothetical protein ACH4OX_06420 [Streptomyces roseolus]|uniref:hypothetical protein n=1 Tax=Streptomyces roseolus TaxID=67358 RepID=UPI0037BC1760
MAQVGGGRSGRGGGPPAPHPHHLFRADPGTFRHTLVRLPAVRSPWLREILENLTDHMRVGLF